MGQCLCIAHVDLIFLKWIVVIVWLASWNKSINLAKWVLGAEEERDGLCKIYPTSHFAYSMGMCLPGYVYQLRVQPPQAHSNQLWWFQFRHWRVASRHWTSNWPSTRHYIFPQRHWQARQWPACDWFLLWVQIFHSP